MWSFRTPGSSQDARGRCLGWWSEALEVWRSGQEVGCRPIANCQSCWELRLRSLDGDGGCRNAAPAERGDGNLVDKRGPRRGGERRLVLRRVGARQEVVERGAERGAEGGSGGRSGPSLLYRQAPGSSTRRDGSCPREMRDGVAFGGCRPGAAVQRCRGGRPLVRFGIPCKKGVLRPIFLDNFLFGSAPPGFAGMPAWPL